MKEIMNFFKSNDVEKISLGVAYGNEEVFGFYEKFGFYPKVTELQFIKGLI